MKLKENKMIKGIFISDVHLPDNINLSPVLSFIHEYQPDLIILGGDIIDAKGMHGVESMQASQMKLEWYERDRDLLIDFLSQLKAITSSPDVIFLEGNHEERYKRIMKKYPDAFGGRFDFKKDVVQQVFPKSKWISYGDYNSFYKLGDCIFTHGNVYPENHAKKYAMTFSPYKVVYGHLHHFQSTTIHSALPTELSKYAVTGGCLCHTSPEWKKGQPNCWLNGFITFSSDKGITTPTVHLIEKGRLIIQGREYK
jgi:UDP-2,3-diacylglucosamine pyrophosphatase LpxH